MTPDSELREQFHEFLERLEQKIANMNPQVIDSLEVLKSFISSKEELYRNIEQIIFAVSVATVTISVESVIESYVSVYENRNNKNRPITEERAHHEMMIAINGPELSNADSIIKGSMSNYWRKYSHSNDWHFTRRSRADDIKPCTISKVIDRMNNQKPCLPFMM